MINQTINERYELIERIGEGGFGSVFKAKDLRLGHHVAVKLLTLTHDEHQQLIKDRFTAEAQISARLQHENILKTFDFGEHNDGQSLFLVSELLTGHTLAQELREGPMPISRVVELMRQLFSGLSEAHEFEIIHRDLKPSNLFVHQRLRNNKPHETLKVIDFGVAKSLESGTKTMTGVVFGSPPYMSPEQIFMPDELSTKSDMYSAGVILFQCLAGALPFEKNPSLPMQIFIKHQREAPPLIHSLNPSFEDPLLQGLTHLLLSKSPAHRPSAAQMITWLDRYTEGSLTLEELEVSELNHTPVPSPLLDEYSFMLPSASSEATPSGEVLTPQGNPSDPSTLVSPSPFQLAPSELAELGVVSANPEGQKKPSTKARMMLGVSLISALSAAWLLLPQVAEEPEGAASAESVASAESAELTLSKPSTSRAADQGAPLEFEAIDLNELGAESTPTQQALNAQLASKEPLSKDTPSDQQPSRHQRKKTKRVKRVASARKSAHKSAHKNKEKRASKPAPSEVTPKPSQAVSYTPLKALRLKIPKKMRFAPGEVVSFSYSITDQNNQRAESKEYELSVKLTPEVGVVKGRKVHLNPDINLSTKATLRVCAQRPQSKLRVCDAKTLFIYKHDY